MGEYLVYWTVRAFGFFLRLLPLRLVLGIGSGIGLLRYYFDIKHRSLVYSNLKIAFAKTKTPNELKNITKSLFKNFGQNLVELFILPLVNADNLRKFIRMEGTEHVLEALKKGKGVILLAMHFGSWEMASLACSSFGAPYNVIVKPQKRFSKLDELLNSYRRGNGSAVISRGSGTRDIIKSLKNNELIGMVMDQGGKDGELVSFFDRPASMSSGAIRLGLKLGVPICLSVIIRENGIQHRLIINKPFELENTGQADSDVITNLHRITHIMEEYIRQYPDNYMWFYKIWKYSTESTTVILSDGKTGHLRQSQTISTMIEAALAQRKIFSKTEILLVQYKSPWAAKWISVVSLLSNAFLFQGRLEFLRKFLTEESFQKIMSVKADFIISCGSSVAPLNYLLSCDHQAKSISVLKPGVLRLNRFDLVVLPQHDEHCAYDSHANVVITKGAPNLITPAYLQEQTELLLTHFSHLKSHRKTCIGLLIGGDSKEYVLNEDTIRIVINQLKEAVEAINADLLVTTSRRTSNRVENLIVRELKKYARCPLVVIPNRAPVEEAVGGILGLSNILIVSGESISMVSEAASSGKNTIVFPAKKRKRWQFRTLKHEVFLNQLNEQGFIVTCDPCAVSHFISDVAKNKIQTKLLDDQLGLLKAVREII